MRDPSRAAAASSSSIDALLAWYFVAVWGAGYIATKIGLQHAAPFTFLSLRFSFGLLCLIPIVVLFKTRWPRTRMEVGHLALAGLLMHAVQLGEYVARKQGLVHNRTSSRRVEPNAHGSRGADVLIE